MSVNKVTGGVNNQVKLQNLFVLFWFKSLNTVTVQKTSSCQQYGIHAQVWDHCLHPNHPGMKVFRGLLVPCWALQQEEVRRYWPWDLLVCAWLSWAQGSGGAWSWLGRFGLRNHCRAWHGYKAGCNEVDSHAGIPWSLWQKQSQYWHLTGLLMLSTAYK